jgi:hypothetical protein
MTPPISPEIAVPTWWAPLLISAIVALAGVIVFLFRYYSKRADLHDKERESWAKERESWALERVRLEGFQTTLRAEYEQKYHETYKTLYQDAREYEAAARREYAENMEIVAQKAAEASEKITTVMNKIYDYLIRPRRPH